mmetsp:Transcript_7145/g.16519  ORF Transcript_7145/g.16519 Transcript_7145/m.16519 type:complete len:202 (-) Transcript_7145:583-1188(-)
MGGRGGLPGPSFRVWAASSSQSASPLKDSPPPREDVSARSRAFHTRDCATCARGARGATVSRARLLCESWGSDRWSPCSARWVEPASPRCPSPRIASPRGASTREGSARGASANRSLYTLGSRAFARGRSLRVVLLAVSASFVDVGCRLRSGWCASVGRWAFVLEVLAPADSVPRGVSTSLSFRRALAAAASACRRIRSVV